MIPKGGSAKLLRGWRGPYKVVEVLQDGRLYILSSGHKVHFERLKRHISGPQEWKILGVNEDDDEIVADPNPESPVEEIASDVEEGSFVEEQRLSNAADELSEWGPATDSHPMETRTRTALQEGRPRRRFEQYADYSSSEEQSLDERDSPDVRLPQSENAEDFFMEDLVTDTENERQGVERLSGASEGEQCPSFAVDSEDWNRDPIQEESRVSDSSIPDFDDPLDSILRQQHPRPTHYSLSGDSETERNQSKPIESKVEDPPKKRRRRPPQRYSPPIMTELCAWTFQNTRRNRQNDPARETKEGSSSARQAQTKRKA